MDYDLFTRAIYSQQNRLDMFLTIPKGQRMRKIDELLAIDRFEKARNSTKSVINKLRNAVKEKEQIIENASMQDSIHKRDSVMREITDVNKKEIEMQEKLKRIIDKKERSLKDVHILKEQNTS